MARKSKNSSPKTTIKKVHHKTVVARKARQARQSASPPSAPAKTAARKSSESVATQEIAPVDLERIVELDFVRTTEAAALSAHAYLGRGDAAQAHAAAVDAVRGTLDLTGVSGTVLFGDGSRPFPNGVERGERVGNWHKGALEVTIGLIPVDGAALVAAGQWGAVAVLVAARGEEPGRDALFDSPCPQMRKMSYGPLVKAGPGQVHMGASVRDNLEIIAGKLAKRVRDLTVGLLDRPENESIIAEVRRAGASARLFTDGDVACMIAPSLPDTGLDVYMGCGGAAETVMAAAAVKCLDGDLLAMLAPADEKEARKIAADLGDKALKHQYRAEDLARGDNVIFCATGITDGNVLRGVHVNGSTATTTSVVMRSRYHTVRKITSTHDLSRKTIRRRSQGEAKI